MGRSERPATRWLLRPLALLLRGSRSASNRRGLATAVKAEAFGRRRHQSTAGVARRHGSARQTRSNRDAGPRPIGLREGFRFVRFGLAL